MERNNNESIFHNSSRKWGQTLESLEETIFGLNEDNVIDSVETTLNFYYDEISPSFNYAISRLIYSSYLSQMNDFNIFFNYMEKVETNEKETNKTDHELFNTFAQFILRLKTQESYYLVEKMIKLNKILPNFVINKDTYIFAHRFNMKNFNDFYSYFSDNHEELSKNDWELHKKFIEEGVNQSEISKIIRNDEIEKLQEISSQNDFDFNQKIKPSLYERCSFINHYNVTLIDYAAFFGSVKCFKYLLMNNAKVENTGKYAVAGGNEEIIHLCEQNHSSFIGAFEAAIMFHRNDIFHYFYDNNFLKYSINEIGELFLFPKNDIVNFKLFNFILENKEVDIYTKNKEEQTALIYASQKGYVDIAQLLLEQEGIDINAKDKYGNTALLYATKNGYTEMAKLLLEQKGIDVNAKDTDENTAFLYASKNGSTEIVKLLLEQKGIDINAKDNKGYSALISAAKNGYIETVKLLLEQEGIDFNAKTKSGQTALFHASEKGYTEIVKLLLQQNGIVYNNTDYWDNTAFLKAVENGHFEIVNLLLEQNGIDINMKGIFEKTALIFASEQNQIKIVKLLLKQKGIDINAKDVLEETALMKASKNGYFKIVELLLNQNGIDINAKNIEKRTAIILANMKSHNDVKDLLLKQNGIDINAKDFDGIRFKYFIAQTVKIKGKFRNYLNVTLY